VRRLLAAAGRAELARLARDRTLLAFDYDGVLAPLLRDPGGAPMRLRTRKLLARVAAAWPVAVITGRSWRDGTRLSGGLARVVAGNHGHELGHARPVSPAVLARVRRWRRDMEAALAGQPGWTLEDKRSTFTVHYGQRRRWRAVGAAVHRAAAGLRGARLVPGKQVLNVLPAEFPHKGDALLRLLRRLRLRGALFLGDDVTDEDAFALGPPRVVGVKVGPGPSRAAYRLADQGEVDELLALLASLREGRGTTLPG
jgi:trehalose 6-phosphate phosphatase